MQINEMITELRIGQASQSVQIQALDKKVDGISNDVKEIRKSLVGDVKDSNKWLKSWVVKLIMILVGSGISAGAIASIVNASQDTTPTISHVDE